MLTEARVSAFIALTFAISACSGVAQNTSPASMPTASMAATPNGKNAKTPATSNRRGAHPNEVIGGGPGKLSVRLGDVALPNGLSLAAINLGIDAIYVTDANGNVSNVVQYDNPQVVNVLDFQNGNVTPIAQGGVPETTYSSLTIVVDRPSSNVVDANGATHPLFFRRSVASQSSANFGTTTSTTGTGTFGQVAITFNQAFAVSNAGMQLDVDFNAFESTFLIGNVAISRPSLSVAADALEGTISGNVTNTSAAPVQDAVVVAVDSNGNTDATTFTDQNGNFFLYTLAAGTYNLTVYNTYTTASGWSISSSGNTNSGASFSGPSVTVTPGQNANVGTISD